MKKPCYIMTQINDWIKVIKINDIERQFLLKLEIYHQEFTSRAKAFKAAKAATRSRLRRSKANLSALLKEQRHKDRDDDSK